MASQHKRTERRSLELDQIKRLVVASVFADDELMERFVLKGGNLIDLIYGVSSRASVDIDLSMADDFAPEELDLVRQKLERNLRDTFGPQGYMVFDVELEVRPDNLSPALAGFWGGYKVTFKLIESVKYTELQGKDAALRRNAVRIGAKGKFEIDISKREFCEPKKAESVDGLRIFVYTPTMVICEKLRAICQQMPEYGPVVNRNRAGSARARDFLDIHTLIMSLGVEMVSAENRMLLERIFAAKRVPLTLLDLIPSYREFHRPDFQAVKDTIKAGVRLKEFDFYFDYVVELCRRLKALGNV